LRIETIRLSSNLVFLFTRDGRQANCVLFANLAKLPSLLPSKSISFPLSRSVSPLATCLATSCRCECGRRRCGAAQQQARLAGLSAVYHYAMRCNTCRAAQAPALQRTAAPWCILNATLDLGRWAAIQAFRPGVQLLQHFGEDSQRTLPGGCGVCDTCVQGPKPDENLSHESAALMAEILRSRATRPGEPGYRAALKVCTLLGPWVLSRRGGISPAPVCRSVNVCVGWAVGKCVSRRR